MARKRGESPRAQGESSRYPTIHRERKDHWPSRGTRLEQRKIVMEKGKGKKVQKTRAMFVHRVEKVFRPERSMRDVEHRSFASRLAYS